MKIVKLDSRPKWRRRLSHHSLHRRVFIVTVALYRTGRGFLLFPPECRDSLATHIEELAETENLMSLKAEIEKIQAGISSLNKDIQRNSEIAVKVSRFEQAISTREELA